MSAVVGVLFPAGVNPAQFQLGAAGEEPAPAGVSAPAANQVSGPHLDVLRRLATEHGLSMPRLQAGALVVPLGDVELAPANEPVAGTLVRGPLAVATAVPLPVQRPALEGGSTLALQHALRSRLRGMTADAAVPIIVTADLRAAAQRADPDGVSTEPRVSTFDMGALQHTSSTPEMRSIFSEGNRVHQWLRIEAALAMVQSRLGVIPAEAGPAIAGAARLENIDLGLMAEGIRETNHSLVPLLRQLQEAVGVHGESVHHGLTTQDVIDTGLVLQMKQAHGVYLRDLGEVGRMVADLASAHRDTVMVGRTHLVHASPITFGHKCAIWLDELGRHYQRLRECEPRVFRSMLVGAVGTQAAFGEHATEIEAQTSEALGLAVPNISWAPARDGLAEYANILAMLGATLSKIGEEMANLQRTEVGEVAEGFFDGKVGSSTMPHKVNPSAAECLSGMAQPLRLAALQMMTCMVHTHERTTIQWRQEWKAMPESCVLTGAALHQAKRLLGGLSVDQERMTANLDITRGYLMSEAVMFAVGEVVGKQTAHRVVYDASMYGVQNGLSFAEAMDAQNAWPDAISVEERERLLDPSSYLGEAGTMIDRTIAAAEAGGWMSPRAA